ncbi:hypothetical protein KKD37_02935 [Patescibacteria group bacterium]|nr:hypothetical protein [Patescibacteria group bacterium]
MTLKYETRNCPGCPKRGSIPSGENETSSKEYKQLRDTFCTLGLMASQDDRVVMSFHSDYREVVQVKDAFLSGSNVVLILPTQSIRVTRFGNEGQDSSVRFSFVRD